MLVRNLTNGNLSVKGVTGKKIILPPLKIVNIDELEFPAERLKRFFGRYIHILTEKVEVTENELPAKVKENLEPKEGISNVPTANETITKEEKGEDNGNADNDKDAGTKNDDNDLGDIDELVDSVLEDIEKEDAGKSVEKENKVKTNKTNKKASKKQ